MDFAIGQKGEMMDDLISRQAAIDVAKQHWYKPDIAKALEELPSAQPEYEPVTLEDFARTMSEITVWEFAAWQGWALALIKEQGFVICKKTM